MKNQIKRYTTRAGDAVTHLSRRQDGTITGRVAFSRYPLGWNSKGRVFDRSRSPLDLVEVAA